MRILGSLKFFATSRLRFDGAVRRVSQPALVSVAQHGNLRDGQPGRRRRREPEPKRRRRRTLAAEKAQRWRWTRQRGRTPCDASEEMALVTSKVADKAGLGDGDSDVNDPHLILIIPTSSS